MPNKWHSAPHHPRSEILCYLPDVAEHDTMHGADPDIAHAFAVPLHLRLRVE
jgi:hypothetical protein